MDKGQKVKVVFEFDRSEYDAYLFLMNQKKTEETEAAWEKMSQSPVTVRPEVLDDQAQSVKLLVVSMAILSVKDKVEQRIKGK